jgi:hypothetical protein
MVIAAGSPVRIIGAADVPALSFTGSTLWEPSLLRVPAPAIQ